MNQFREEHDTMGTVMVPAEHKWGAQTQRSLQNFAIGSETIPGEIIRAFALLKKAAAEANLTHGKLTKEQSAAITAACDEIYEGKWPEEFPLKVWQTGSGTQSNMNVNEVIAHICADKGVTVHPNDHVNASQSSNDTFPTAMNVAAVCAVSTRLLPELERLAVTLRNLEEENADIIKIGRTHLQDAVPLRFSQEISGWRTMVEESGEMIRASLKHLRYLALGGTAVGTGLNAPATFGAETAALIGALGIVKAPIAEKALPYCNIVCLTGAEMQEALSAYLQVLYDLNPASVGGKLPEDSFYYVNEESK